MKFKTINTQSGEIEKTKFYSYQKKTLDRVKDSERIIVQYGRQMGLTMLLSYLSLENLSHHKNILYLSPKHGMNDSPMRNLEINVVNDKNYHVSHTNKMIHFGQNFINFSTMNHDFEVDWNSLYDLIIIDCPQFFSNTRLNSIMDMIESEEFRGKVILGNTGSSKFRGCYYNAYKNSSLYDSVTARRFIHPSFNSKWYHTMISMLGRETYRLEYECRFK